MRAFRTASKFGNKVTTTSDGCTHHSIGEADRWEELKLLEKSGAIRDLRRQVTFRIDVNGHHICKYIADFVYREHGQKRDTIEDFKGAVTDVYRLKKKLMRAVHDFDIIEVFAKRKWGSRR